MVESFCDMPQLILISLYNLIFLEGDTIDSGKNRSKIKNKASFVTIVERKTRYCIIVKVENKTSETVAKAIIEVMKDLIEGFIKTITFDIGCGIFKL